MVQDSRCPIYLGKKRGVRTTLDTCYLAVVEWLIRPTGTSAQDASSQTNSDLQWTTICPNLADLHFRSRDISDLPLGRHNSRPLGILSLSCPCSRRFQNYHNNHLFSLFIFHASQCLKNNRLLACATQICNLQAVRKVLF